MKKLSFVLVLLALASMLMGQVLMNEGFEGTTFPEGWSTHNAGVGNEWTIVATGGNPDAAMKYSYDADNAANTWAFTAGLELETGNSYIISFDYKTSTSYPENLKVTIGTAQTVDAQNVTLFDESEIATSTFLTTEIPFTPETNGTYYIGFNCYSAADMFNIFVDNIKVETLLANDLIAQSITGNITPTANNVYDYVITVLNYGTVTAESYTVNLMQVVEGGDDLVLGTEPGSNLLAAQEAEHSIAWTPTVSENYQLYGKVIYDNDESLDNNTTDILNVSVQSEGTVMSYIGNPASTTTATNPPLNFFYKSSVSQTIYLENEINAGGLIESISYNFTGYGDIPEGSPVSIYMATTDLEVFETNADWIPYEEFTLVYEGGLDNTTAGNYELLIELSEPFPYGGGNLVIMAHRPLDAEYYSSSNKYQTTSFETNRTLKLNSDSIEYDLTALATGTLTTEIANTSLYFNTAGLGSISGVVTHNDAPLADVEVTVQGTSRRAYSNENGEYTIGYVSEGTVTLVASKFGFENTTIEGVAVVADESTTQNITMTQLPTVTVSGTVIASDTQEGLANAEITLTGYENYDGITTNANGEFEITGVYTNKTYVITVTRENYQSYTDDLVEVGETDLTMSPITLLELSNPPANVVAVATDSEVALTWSAPGSVSGLSEFSDDFEGDFSNWDEVIQGAGTPGEGGTPYWFIGAPDGNPYEGNCARVDWGYDINTWLITPPISVTANTIVSYDFYMSYYWAVDPNDNQDLMVKVSTDGNNWTQIWREEDFGTFENWSWLNTSISLAEYAGQAVYVAFNLVGDDNAVTTIDNVFIGDARSNGNQIVSTPNYNFTAEKSASLLNHKLTKKTAKDDFSLEYTKYNKSDLERIARTTSQVSYNRAIESYKIYRANVTDLDNENLWEAIANDVQDTTYTDLTWATVETGEFKYVVKAVYSNDVLSTPAFSNSVSKNMSAVVNITVNTEDNGSVNGAVITLTNNNGNPAHIYTQTATTNAVNFPNVWLGTYTITAQLAGYSTVTNENIDISTSPFSYEITLPVSSLVLDDDFESYTDFSIDFAPWTLVDLDMLTTFGIQNVSFPHSMEAMAFIVFNPSQTVPATTVAEPYSGQKMAACFGAEGGENNDWMISPQFLASAGSSISFQAKSATDQYGLERFKIAVGTTPNPAEMTFINPGNYVEAPVEWTEFNYSLADYAGQNIYVGIVCVSNDAFILFIDDVKIEGSTDSNDNTIVTPQTTQLNANYPNPFNPTTFISFDNAQDGNVRIDIFNVKGQKVKTLVNDHFKAGAHKVEWNGTDENNKNVSSGIYFYNMKSGKYTATRKMILMK